MFPTSFRSGNSSNLNLSAIELNDDTCKGIGQALRKDVFLQELDLSNCMLRDDGLSSILSGIETNKFLLTLNLKGNNVRSTGAALIGKLLRHNNHLQNLDLEWNNTGTFPEKFSELCEGLCLNCSLKSLDLRNNQLNHLCAQSIAAVLYRNSTLQTLDLRWNSIGLIGGRLILKSLSKNKSILKLNITGNDVPFEIEKAIDMASSAATERYLKNSENLEKTKFFASKLQDLELEQNKQLKSFMEQLEKKDEDMKLNERWNSTKLGQLQETLAEKDSVIEDLIKKSREFQKKLAQVTGEKNEIALVKNQMNTVYKELEKELQSLIDQERKEKEDSVRKFLEETGTMKEENLFLQKQIQESKIHKDNLEDQIIKLQSTVSKMEKMAKLDEESFQEQISSLNNKHQEIIREMDEVRKKEIWQIKEEFSAVEDNLRQRIKLLENRRNDLEKQIIDRDAKIMEIKVQAEERIEQLRKNMKTDEEKLQKQYEERIKLLESANKRQDDLLKEQLEAMHEIKKKSTENDILLAEEAHQKQHLLHILESKDAEMNASIVKVKLEVKEQLEEFSRVKKLFENSVAECASFKEKVAEMEKEHREEMQSKDEKLKKFKQEIKKQRCKMKEILLTENKRIDDLQTAFASYAKSVKLSTDEVDEEDKSINSS